MNVDTPRLHDVPAVEWLADAVIYNIFPASFRDSNGDGIGDLPGITDSLEYVASLGANVVWLNPIYDSPFGDAGYDVRDYRKIAPRYGTLEDFDAMVARAHELGLRLLLDFVPGHTSIEHPWFVESASGEPSRYDNWYVWTDHTFAPVPGDLGTFVNGYSQRDGRYLANFFWFQPALNYGFANPREPWQLAVDHPDVAALRAEMRSIMAFWLDRGIDGFRVDMAPSLIKGPGQADAMRSYWRGIREWFDAEYPHAALVSEWSYPLEAIDAGFHVDFLIHVRQAAYNELLRAEPGANVLPGDGTSIFRASGGGRPERFWDEYERHYHATRESGAISIPTGNHDLPRVGFARTKAELETVFLFVLTMPGVPAIYYGDEIGMRHLAGVEGFAVNREGAYNRTGARSPMQWSRGESRGFSSAPPEVLYLPVDPDPDASTVSQQTDDPDSLLSFVRSLVSLRHEHPALGGQGHFARAHIAACPATAARTIGRGYPLCYLRWAGRERLLVCVNPTGEALEAKLIVPWRSGRAERLFGDPAVEVSDTDDGLRVAMPPICGAVFEIE